MNQVNFILSGMSPSDEHFAESLVEQGHSAVIDGSLGEGEEPLLYTVDGAPPYNLEAAIIYADCFRRFLGLSVEKWGGKPFPNDLKRRSQAMKKTMSSGCGFTPPFIIGN